VLGVCGFLGVTALSLDNVLLTVDSVGVFFCLRGALAAPYDMK